LEYLEVLAQPALEQPVLPPPSLDVLPDITYQPPLESVFYVLE